MKLVTLTTDWGTSDFFAGMVKGRLYSMIPDVQVIDITHNIEPYNRLKTAFIVR
ncbi:MAG: SAM-dependent chlorinase/fluorinase, partial [Bacteroidales bacterium]|nr:SAM-dependent chlorinase/fluorinase [Bacteroidales bacterium]